MSQSKCSEKGMRDPEHRNLEAWALLGEAKVLLDDLSFRLCVDSAGELASRIKRLIDEGFDQ